MRVGIEACCWSNRRGYGRYLRELVTHMVAEFPQHEFILVTDQQTAAESQFPASARIEVVATREQATKAASASGSRSPLDLWRLGRAAAKLRPDLFFFPSRYSYFPLLARVPVVLVVHDASDQRHPELMFSGWKPRLLWNLKSWMALRQARQLVTVSESARAQIAAAFGYPETAIRVVLEGPNPAFHPLADRSGIRPVLDQYGLPADKPLLLYVGGISPHKNLQGLLHALTKLRDQAWHLVLVGDFANDSFFGCYQELQALARQLELTKRVTFTGFVPDEHLLALYNAAMLLVLPSFNEGFGLPVVEAMACGLPVAASNRGSLPEVLGQAGVFFDPEDYGAMAAALDRLLSNASVRSAFQAEGLRRVERFSWKAAAREMVRVFEETAGVARPGGLPRDAATLMMRPR